MPKIESHAPIINSANIAQIRQYTLPELRINKTLWYIEFYAYEPTSCRLKRKRIKINRIKDIKARRQYASGLIYRITQQLISGWNPWIERDNEYLMTFAECIDIYIKYINRMYDDELYRSSTYDNYMVMLNKIIAYNKQRKQPIYYMYQFDAEFVRGYIDYVYLTLEHSAQYCNNCLTFVKTFGRWCQQKGYIRINPSADIQAFSSRLCIKKREIIPDATLKEISSYLREKDRHFLLSCYLLYYCCIRPGEQVKLKLSDINLSKATITIPVSVSKNKKEQTITIPKKVIHYMLDLKIFNSEQDCYIFSRNLMPGTILISRRALSKHWDKLRKQLNLKKEYQFYSLKDTGITKMLHQNVSNISVRDQARHSSLSITNIYAQAAKKDANEELIDYEGGF